jgi:hypothetical protein
MVIGRVAIGHTRIAGIETRLRSAWPAMTRSL